MEPKEKRVKDSAIDNQTALVFPNDLNIYGTLFGGKVLELGDWLCGIVAKRHTGKVCVTLGLDTVRFHAPATIGDILILKAAINRTWNTSMEIGLKVFAENYRTGEKKHIFSAYFTFVALDETRKPSKIPAIVPETEEEKRRYKQAGERRQKRLNP